MKLFFFLLCSTSNKVKCTTKVAFFKREEPSGTSLFCPRGVHLVHLVLPGTREAVSCQVKTQKQGAWIWSVFSFLPFSCHPEISVLNLVTFSAGVVFYWNIVTFGRYKGTISSMTLLLDSFTLFSHANTFYWMSFLHANIPCHDKGIKCLETEKQITWNHHLTAMEEFVCPCETVLSGAKSYTGNPMRGK